ncbi:MAG TPA: autotransporter outer membrane beta-barrel domain-containing protein [Rhizomicrobium sp.]|nr:autotransporter outer membrane beta-barrel domain-containing protein [Rhizomicrobium sp.]
MRKRSLMFSTAAIALLSGAAFADTTISTSTSTALWTGTLPSGATGTGSQGNITVQSAGSIGVAVANQGAITVNSDNWVLNQGAITDKDNDGAHGIRVDLSTDRNLSGATFTDVAGDTITGTGIYLDSSSNLAITGSGTGKFGIYLDASNCTTSCTYTGNITAASSSTINITGDSSAAFQSTAKSVLDGDLTLGGTIAVTANTTTNTNATGVYGVLSYGQINGNVSLPAGGTMTVSGQGARGISIQGTGVDGYVSIGGSITTTMPYQQVTSINQKVNTTTNPEGGPALEVGASVTQGIAILGPTVSASTTSAGTLAVRGSGPGVYIAPVSSSVAPTTPLTIGVYTGDTADQNFSFYNRGQITVTPNNYNDSAAGMAISGYSTAVPTVLNGGIFNSGTMSVSVTTSGDNVYTGSGCSSCTSSTATGIYIGSYSDIDVGTGKTTDDNAALVNSGAVSSSGGVISASINGSRGGLAYGVLIGANAYLPSINNSGTISAVAATTDKTLTGNASGSYNPLAARAIVDQSGTLIKIVNSGTIYASAGYQASTSSSTLSALDNDTQIATAIDLRGGTDLTASGSGVEIDNFSSSSRAAIITGDILFGSGNNQVLDLRGSSSQYVSAVAGNVVFGAPQSSSLTSGDRLIIEGNSSLTGAVVTQTTLASAGVRVDVQTGGTLTLLNNSDALKPLNINCTATPDSCQLKSTSFNVQAGGTVNIGVNQALTQATPLILAQNVNFAANSNLNVAYASFVPQGSQQFVLMAAQPGHLNIDPTVLSAYNDLPASQQKYLLASTHMDVVNVNTVDQLVLSIVPKTVDQIGFSANTIPVQTAPTSSGPTTLFEQVNKALASDDSLGSAMINGVHSAQEAQQAYDSFAPNLTGGTRAIVISITDQASGPVGARERALNMYGKSEGGMTLWGQEFFQMLKDPGSGSIDPNTGFKTTPGYKDHGFGFALGLDGGSPKYGWYGGAFTFYAGDVNELARISHENQQWYLLSLYSVWRGKGLFLDTKLDAGYGHIDAKRMITLTDAVLGGTFVREADNKHAGALISGGVTTGAMFSYGAMTLMPQLSLDGLYMREEGYTENNPNTTTVGDAFDLTVNPYYAKSLRGFLGADVRYDLNLWDVYLQPEARAGYRYDFLSDPVKLKMAFAYSDTSNPLLPKPGTTFQLTGPDPSQGNFVLGGSLGATTDTWTLGLSFDFVRGSNGAFEQVGTISLLGRI